MSTIKDLHPIVCSRCFGRREIECKCVYTLDVRARNRGEKCDVKGCINGRIDCPECDGHGAVFPESVVKHIETLNRRLIAMTRARDAWREHPYPLDRDDHSTVCDARNGKPCACPARLDKEAE